MSHLFYLDVFGCGASDSHVKRPWATFPSRCCSLLLFNKSDGTLLFRTLQHHSVGDIRLLMASNGRRAWLHIGQSAGNNRLLVLDCSQNFCRYTHKGCRMQEQPHGGCSRCTAAFSIESPTRSENAFQINRRSKQQTPCITFKQQGRDLCKLPANSLVH